MTVADQNSLLAAAAKAVLRPLGCMQKGRSRTWLDDHTWWLGVIEFQPSSWAKGSYLNVGACWLWSGKDYMSFDNGYRVEPFHEYKGIEQFESVAQIIAERAKEEALKLRGRFGTIESTATYLQDKKTKEIDIWGHYHAGVSAGLVGWKGNASHRLEMALAVEERDTEWARTLKSQCAGLLSLLDNTDLFKSYVEKLVIKQRGALKLPTLTERVRFDL